MNLITKTWPGVILTLTLISSGSSVKAIPAIPEPIKIVQPDGSELTLRMYGDETGFTIVTLDNLPLVKNSAGVYEYADPKDITVSSGIRVSEVGQRGEAEESWLNASGLRSKRSKIIKNYGCIKRKGEADPSKIRISNFPTLGHQKALVILVEFSDKGFTSMEDPYGYYNGMLNEEGFTFSNGANGSARDFYLDSSSGLFDPEFVVVGPVKLSETVAYYGADTNGQLDPNAWEMIVDACKAVDEEVDFTEFDADHDGVVDSIYFFYAGFGEADSMASESIWPHSGLLKNNWGVDLELDGMVINNYACSNEIRFNSAPIWQPVGIGTFVHEFGHVLGLADHYDTLSTSGRIGVQEWDTMSAAAYNNNQNTPPSFSAFERAELGWMEYTEVDAKEAGVLRVPVLGCENSGALRIKVPSADADEYFIIERRNKTGWDATLPAEGLLVWHIDMVPDLWKSNQINVDPVHQHIDLVEADGTENTTSYHGDVFPGTGNITKHDFKSWNGETLFSFDHLVQLPDETLVVLGNTEFKPKSPSVNIEDVHGTSFKLSWDGDENSLEYILSVIDSSDNPVEGYMDLLYSETGEMEISGLNPDSDYYVSATAKSGSYLSESVKHAIHTGMLEFFESSPLNPAVKYVGENSFEASWDKLAGASDYAVSLYRMEYGEPEDYTYGFEKGIEGMPQGWSTNTSKLSKPVFGEKSPALKFENDGDYLELNYPESQIASLSFYQSSQVDTNSVKIEAYTGDDVSKEFTLGLSSTGKIENIQFETGVDKVILKFERTSGYMILDDVTVSVKHLNGIECEPYIDYSTSGATNVRLEKLEMNQEYGLIVVGSNDVETSRESELFRFVPSTLITGIATISEDSQIEDQWYDLSGRPVSGKGVEPGIYIVRRGNEVVKVFKK